MGVWEYGSMGVWGMDATFNCNALSVIRHLVFSDKNYSDY
jgi:hypothetical protein